MKDKEAIELIKVELASARGKYAEFASPHKAWAVIYERVDNLWETVKQPPLLRNKTQERAEAARVAAMAMRYLTDLCESEVLYEQPVAKA